LEPVIALTPSITSINGASLSSAVKYIEPCRSVLVKLPTLTKSYPAAGAPPEINEAETEEPCVDEYTLKLD
jgi:hypothetical protein